jgi:transcriptional regulator with XRE-family HTH domain
MLNLQLKKIRKAKGKTQEEVATAIGVGARTYQSYEAGTSDIKISDLEKLAIFLNVEPAEFFKKDAGNGNKSGDIKDSPQSISNAGELGDVNITGDNKEILYVLLDHIKLLKEQLDFYKGKADKKG